MQVKSKYLAEDQGDDRLTTTVPEPANGTVVVVEEPDDERKVIVRDDARAEAHGWDEHDEHWFGGFGDDPMGWAEHLRYAVAVYVVPAEPLAATQ